MATKGIEWVNEYHGRASNLSNNDNNIGVGDHQEISIHNAEADYFSSMDTTKDLIFFNNNNHTTNSPQEIISISKKKITKSKGKKFLFGELNKSLKMFTANGKNSETDPNSELFRLFVKNGEHVYARANDIIMIESCDHLVKVYLGINNKVKLTIRHNTLKDFLSQLPKTQFIRINRFCAVNILRLSGGNCNEQTFEFDFRTSVKLTHPVSHMVFSAIGK